MNDDLLLSQLLDGDLDEEAAAALRIRLDNEPALAARHAALRAMIEALGSMETAIRAPATPRALSGARPAPQADPAAALTGALANLAAFDEVFSASPAPAARGAHRRRTDPPPPPPSAPAAAPPTKLEPAPAAPPVSPRAAPPAASPGRGPWLRWLPPLAAAAFAAGLTFALRPEPAEVLLLEGSSVVEGHTHVLAAGVPIEIEGRVRISVEPPAGAPRVSRAESSTMDRSHFAAAFAGAVVSVSVLEGHAWIRGTADAAPLSLDAGVTTAVTVGGQTPRVAGSGRSGSPKPLDLPAAQARIRDLESQLAAAKLDAGLSHGALTTHEGTPQRWPDDASAPFRPDAFRARLEEAVRGVPGAAIAEVDCDEFPCVAALATVSEAEDWADSLGAVQKSMSADPRFGAVGVTAMAQETNDGELQHRLYVFALSPAGADSDAQTRTQYRAKSLLDQLGGGAGAEDTLQPAEMEKLQMLGYIDVAD